MARTESICGGGPLSAGNETGSIADWAAGGASEFLFWAASLSRSQASKANAEASRIFASILTPLILPAFHDVPRAALDAPAMLLRCSRHRVQSWARQKYTCSECPS